jgi:peptidoglycan/xylan/chitin deacetylase (PgdA/CDA1 family)
MPPESGERELWWSEFAIRYLVCHGLTKRAGEKLSSDNSLLTSLKLQVAYFSGRMWWSSRGAVGAGAILRFERVRPRRDDRFQPLRSSEITPQFLDRTLRALKRWKYDIIGIDEACERAVILPRPQRFVSLSFDGAFKDLITSAYPILSGHGVPFTIYVPTAFPDGVGEAWWLALEKIVAREIRVSLVIDRNERRFAARTLTEKYETFHFLLSWLRTLAPVDLFAAIHDLCARYSVDLAALSREASMDWADLATLAADPNVTIGCATVNYPVLANLKDPIALREMAMGRAVAETALRRQVRHFAYPFGERETWRRAHVVMTEEAGFASAVSTIPGVVQPAGHTNLHALPRIAWDGRQTSLRAMRVLLSGITFPPVQPTRSGKIVQI